MVDEVQKQPTILIKKADGTTERVTLQEFQKRKARAATTPIQKSTSFQPAPVGTPQPKLVQSSARQAASFTDDAQMSPPKPARRAIPLILEEPSVPQPPHRARPAAPPTPQRRSVQLVEDASLETPVEKKRPVILVEDTSEDMDSLPVVAREQHIANTTPVTRVFEQPTITPNSIDHRSLLDEDEGEIRRLAEEHKTTHAPTTGVSFSSSISIPADLEARTSALVLSWKKGIRDRNQFLEYALKPAMQGGLGLSERDAEQFFMDISGTAVMSKPQPMVKPRPVVSSQMSPTHTSPQYKKPSMSQVSQPASLIREIAPTSDTTRVMGPVEEVASFSLEDFRRLSRDPKIAASMVLAKISGWKDESYLLYLQVRDSWKISPLFQMYIQKTVEAIQKNISILSALQGSELQYEEYIAIAEVNQKMGLMD